MLAEISLVSRPKQKAINCYSAQQVIIIAKGRRKNSVGTTCSRRNKEVNKIIFVYFLAG
jgi:hypothetical protein